MFFFPLSYSSHISSHGSPQPSKKGSRNSAKSTLFDQELTNMKYVLPCSLTHTKATFFSQEKAKVPSNQYSTLAFIHPLLHPLQAMQIPLAVPNTKMAAWQMARLAVYMSLRKAGNISRGTTFCVWGVLFFFFMDFFSYKTIFVFTLVEWSISSKMLASHPPPPLFIYFFKWKKKHKVLPQHFTKQNSENQAGYFKQGWRNKDTCFQIEFHKFVIWRISTKLTSGSQFYALLNIYSALTLNL